MLPPSVCITAHQRTSIRIFLHRRASKRCFQHRFRSLPSDYTALTDYAAIDQRVAGWPVWLASRCSRRGSGKEKQPVANEKTISGQRKGSPRSNVRCPAAEGARSAGRGEERQERRDEVRDYRKTPLEATCRQADSEMRRRVCFYHQCASQRIRQHLCASFCAAEHLRDVFSVGFAGSFSICRCVPDGDRLNGARLKEEADWMTLTEWTPTGWTPTGRWPRTMAKEKQPVANEKTISGGREEVKPETTGRRR